MRRGDIYWVDLEPIKGSEAGKTRPAVIVSNNAANRAAEQNARGVITVVPVTTNVKRVLPFQVLLPAAECGLEADSKAQAEQVRSVAIERIQGRAGRVSPKALHRLDQALSMHLAL
ncbi:type II toxin-antitoxin system PemK/MazF family toxin [Nonomuraea dietziae]|uniref:type II toxin-antitoxin system PemK/MazF family toxin n=1 Tax=Nonomuraea dietziae TaxID=65515 RepID=UPI0034339AE0